MDGHRPGRRACRLGTQAYTVTDLGNLGFPNSSGFGINATGEVVGQSYLAKPVKVSPCPTGGDVCEVRPPAAFNWIAGKIDAGNLAGYINSHASTTGSWSAATRSTAAAPCGTSTTSFRPDPPIQINDATAINDNGRIVANADGTATHRAVALLLTPN